MAAKPPPFTLFTSLRYDPALLSSPENTEVSGSPSPYLLFPYHHERLLNASRDFGWQEGVKQLSDDDAGLRLQEECERCIKAYNENTTSGIRIRIIVDFKGDIRAEAFPALPFSGSLIKAALFDPTSNEASGLDVWTSSPLRVLLDSQPTPSSEFTRHKTLPREHYEQARQRAGIISRTSNEEVVLYNESQEISEASIRNVAFWRDGWVTPPLSSGCLPGTVRRLLLERKLIREGTIAKDNLIHGEWVLLSNGMDGAALGRLELI